LGLTLFGKHSPEKFLGSILFLAIVTELVQIWVPSRSFNIFDMLSNAVGVISGVLLAGVVSLKGK
jgi:VanZ family protein